MKRRTTIVIDEDLLDDAKDVLGTSGLKDTVHRALEEVVAASRRTRLAALMRRGEAFDFESAAIDRENEWRTAGSS